LNRKKRKKGRKKWREASRKQPWKVSLWSKSNILTCTHGKVPFHLIPCIPAAIPASFWSFRFHLWIDWMLPGFTSCKFDIVAKNYILTECIPTSNAVNIIPAAVPASFCPFRFRLWIDWWMLTGFFWRSAFLLLMLWSQVASRQIFVLLYESFLLL